MLSLYMVRGLKSLRIIRGRNVERKNIAHYIMPSKNIRHELLDKYAFQNYLIQWGCRRTFPFCLFFERWCRMELGLHRLKTWNMGNVYRIAWKLIIFFKKFLKIRNSLNWMHRTIGWKESWRKENMKPLLEVEIVEP